LLSVGDCSFLVPAIGGTPHTRFFSSQNGVYGFRSLNFAFGRFVTLLAEAMGEYKSFSDNKKAKYPPIFRFEFKDLVTSRQMLKLSFIPDLALITHPGEKDGKLTLFAISFDGG